MGKGDSSNATTNNTETYSGANQVSGSDNLTLSGVQSVGNVNLTSTDFDSVNSAFKFAGDSMDSVTGLASKINDTSEALALSGMALGSDIADKNTDFMSNVLTSYQQGVNSNTQSALSSIGSTIAAYDAASNSEASQSINTLIKYATAGVIGVGVLYTINKKV